MKHYRDTGATDNTGLNPATSGAAPASPPVITAAATPPPPPTPAVSSRGTFGMIGGAAGIGYGLYFARNAGSGWMGYAWWAVIFGLAFHEIGEQVDRRLKKMTV